MAKITKKNAIEFYNEVMDTLEEYGATGGVMPDSYNVDTELGNLNVSIRNDHKGREVYSIFTRFDDVEKAKNQVCCNPYSGKHNFHGTDKLEVLRNFTGFMARFAFPKEITG